MVIFDVTFLGHDSLISAKFHFNFLFYDMFCSLNVVFLIHLSLPTIKLTRVLQPHLHLSQLLSRLPLLRINQRLLPLQRSRVQLHRRLVLRPVRHRTWPRPLKPQRLPHRLISLLSYLRLQMC
jgi:hypothetical protein